MYKQGYSNQQENAQIQFVRTLEPIEFRLVIPCQHRPEEHSTVKKDPTNHLIESSPENI